MYTRTLLLSLALGACLQASAPVHFGCAFQVNAPLSDLKTDLNDKVGFGGSFQVSFELGERGFVRPRLDLDTFPVSSYNRSGSNYHQEVGLNSVGLGADWLYAFSGNRNQGVYGLAGIGVLQWSQTMIAADHSHDSIWSSTDTKKNRVSPWISLGLGYQINHLVGLELRGVASRYDGPTTGGLQAPFTEVPTSLRTAAVAQAVLTLRW
jgi:hypothetical protein